MTWKSICCGHTNWSGFALNRTGKMGHEYFKWPLSCQGTNLLAQMFFSQSHLIATQDWPQLQVSSSPSVCERSVGTLPESLFSSTIPPAGFLHRFSLWSTISCSRALHLKHGNHTYSGAWAGSRVPVFLRSTYPRFTGNDNNSQRFPTTFQQCLAGCIQSLSFRMTILKCLSLCFSSRPYSSHNLEEGREELGSMPWKSMEGKSGR